MARVRVHVVGGRSLNELLIANPPPPAESPLERELSGRLTTTTTAPLSSSLSASQPLVSPTIIVDAATTLALSKDSSSQSHSQSHSDDSHDSSSSSSSQQFFAVSLGLALVDVSRDREKDAHRAARDHGDALPTLPVTFSASATLSAAVNSFGLSGSFGSRSFAVSPVSAPGSGSSSIGSVGPASTTTAPSSPARTSAAGTSAPALPLQFVRRLSRASWPFITHGIAAGAASWDERFYLQSRSNSYNATLGTWSEFGDSVDSAELNSDTESAGEGAVRGRGDMRDGEDQSALSSSPLALSSPELSPERDSGSPRATRRSLSSIRTESREDTAALSSLLRSLRSRSPESARSTVPFPCWCLVLAVGTRRESIADVDVLGTAVVPLRRLSTGEHSGWCTIRFPLDSPVRNPPPGGPAIFVKLEHLGPNSLAGASVTAAASASPVLVPSTGKFSHRKVHQSVEGMSPQSRKRLSLMVEKQGSPNRMASRAASLDSNSFDFSSEFEHLLESEKGRAIVSSAIKKSDRNAQKSEAFALKWDLPPTEKVHKTWSAALHRNILIHGRLVLTEHFLVFHSNIFGVKTAEVVDLHDVTDIRKNRKNLSLGIEVTFASPRERSKNSVLNFASFFARDKAFRQMCLHWQQCKTVGDKRLSAEPLIESTSTKSEDDGHDDEDDAADDDEDDEESVDSFELGDGVYVSNNAEPQLEFLKADSARMTPSTVETLSGCSSIAKFFAKFWADDSFYNRYHKERGDDKIVISEWTELASLPATLSQSPNAERVESQLAAASPTFRQGQFLSPYKAPFFAPKSASNAARCEETQRYHLTKTQLVVEARQYMMDVPFGDYFCVESRWVAREEDGNIRVETFVGVHFYKKTIFSSKISAEVTKQTTASFEMWLSLAQADLDASFKPGAGVATTSKSVHRSVGKVEVRGAASPLACSSLAEASGAGSGPTVVSTTVRQRSQLPLQVGESFQNYLFDNWALVAVASITFSAAVLIMFDWWNIFSASVFFGTSLALLLERHLFILQEQISNMQRTQQNLEVELAALRAKRVHRRTNDSRNQKSKDSKEVKEAKL